MSPFRVTADQACAATATATADALATCEATSNELDRLLATLNKAIPDPTTDEPLSDTVTSLAADPAHDDRPNHATGSDDDGAEARSRTHVTSNSRHTGDGPIDPELVEAAATGNPADVKALAEHLTERAARRATDTARLSEVPADTAHVDDLRTRPIATDDFAEQLAAAHRRQQTAPTGDELWVVARRHIDQLIDARRRRACRPPQGQVALRPPSDGP